jgi:DNA replication protein DnaC
VKKISLIGSRKSLNCQLHGIYESNVITIAGREHPGRCPLCVAAERPAEGHASIAERNRSLLVRAEIPPRYLSRTFENYRSVSPKAREALRSCENYAECFEHVRKHGTGLILCGRPGTGKTHLVCAIARQVILTHSRSVWYTTVAQAVRLVKQTYDRDASGSEAEALKRFQQPDLLILDEVGMQRGTEYEVMLIGEVIDKRYAAVLPTVLVTNHTHTELAQFIGPRAIDRMYEGGGLVLSFDWDSYRPKVEKDKDLAWPADTERT